jgi:hypothetical protein
LLLLAMSKGQESNRSIRKYSGRNQEILRVVLEVITRSGSLRVPEPGSLRVGKVRGLWEIPGLCLLEWPSSRLHQRGRLEL